MKLTQENIKRVHNLIGAIVFNKEGERLGYIVGTLNVRGSESNKENPEYIILGSDSIDESSTKYFAVPAQTKLIDMSEPDTTITAMFTKVNLVRAKRMSVDSCPSPFDYEPLIYELTDYTVKQ